MPPGRPKANTPPRGAESYAKRTKVGVSLPVIQMKSMLLIQELLAPVFIGLEAKATVKIGLKPAF